MRFGAALLVVWLIIGALAAGQRLLQLIAHQLRQGGHGVRDDRRGPAQLCGRQPQGLV